MQIRVFIESRMDETKKKKGVESKEKKENDGRRIKGSLLHESSMTR
jgi:hypothetical protein